MPKQSNAVRVVVHYKPDTSRMVQAILAVLLWPSPGAEQRRDQLNEVTLKKGGSNGHK